MVSTLTSAQLPAVVAGKIERLEDFQSDYIPGRHIDVWLPPNYDSSTQYPVLYMHDGQMLFDAKTTWNGQAWEIDDIATELINTNKIDPVIIVGIWNGGENRHSEYFPQKPFELLSQQAQEKEYTKLRGEVSLFSKPIYSDSYLKFIVEELKPFIKRKYNGDNDRAYLMGSSMGGLISWYGLLEYPDEFLGAACLSTHWPGTFEAKDNPLPAKFVSYITDRINNLTKQRLYFDHGTEDLDAMYPPLQKKVDVVMHNTKLDWLSLAFEGANHSENAWAERLHIPLLFLLNGQKPLE